MNCRAENSNFGSVETENAMKLTVPSVRTNYVGAGGVKVLYIARTGKGCIDRSVDRSSSKFDPVRQHRGLNNLQLYVP